MLFCPKCGSIMSTKIKNGKNVAACSCGYVGKESVKPLTEKINKKSSDIQVVEKQTETLPTIEEECPKCGHQLAYYWTIQTRAGDEGETKFLKCKKCNHTWRDYG